ncbi:YkgJ family cysteine cluster protein [Pseudooceanicola nanhaiensis]|uniref:YkgJ family cysteine cluster protein n=1 Tax=Pseudooceanicola nanhaiensis TaxID=375761 RepID=UPI001CD2D55E|nr:YkgJ family cysteine cluster protein [Pseudooceanicola nanhaiensis]MCA0923013.1 YkgJ family cysteine cluster protein [Pseudooceanicola nanhaiensis]
MSSKPRAPKRPSDLKPRLAKARARGMSGPLEERARRMLAAYLDMAEQHGLSLRETVSEMAGGQAAWRLGSATRDAMLANPPEAVRNAACTAGCAFCCILTEGDGGLITEAEATRLHAALSPLAGQPDGRDWHRAACPALDPDTRACRAYEARPMICRSFLSTDAEACRVNAEGGTAEGSGLLGSHLDYLATLAVVRDALKGIAQVPSYAMARIAAGAVEGETLEESLKAARHAPKVLEETCRDAARAAGA